MRKKAGLGLLLSFGILLSGCSLADVEKPVGGNTQSQSAGSAAQVLNRAPSNLAVTENVVLHSKSISVPTIFTAKSKSIIRSKASTKSKRVGSLSAGKQVEKVGANSKGTWIKIKNGSKTGWVSANLLSKQPRINYVLGSKQLLKSKAGSGSTRAILSSGSSVTGTGRTSGSHSQVYTSRAIGWVESSSLKRVYKAKYKVKTYTVASSSAGGKATSGSVYKNQIVGSYSGSVKGSKGTKWTQIRIGNQDRWIKSSRLSKISIKSKISTPTLPIGKYKAVRATKLYSSPNGKQRSSLVKNYVAGSPTKEFVKAGGRSWIHVYQSGKHQWVKSSDFKATSKNATVGPPKAAPKPKPKPKKDLISKTRTKWSNADWIAATKNNIKKYCPNTPVKLVNNGYYATSHPPTIFMTRKGHTNPNWADYKSIALHECAHIRQYKTYGYEFDRMQTHMDALWGKKGKNMGVEFMADCMSDVMGGKRAGTLPNGWTYWSGYGTTCNTKQYSAAKKVLSGKKIK